MNNSDKTILHLCADTGSDSFPYRKSGEYEVILIGKSIGVENYHPPKDKNIYGIFANPVCTEFSVARTGGKALNPEKGMLLVRECLRIIEECNPFFWVMENPASGKLKHFLGEPIMTYEPWNFGSPWTKKTSLWGNFIPPEKIYLNWEDVPKIQELPIYQGRKKPSLAKLHKNHKKYIKEFDIFSVDDDREFRSLCSQKFAKAFYEVNK